MKSKEGVQLENRALKSQNSKSTEIITQLKEVEKKVRDLMVCPFFLGSGGKGGFSCALTLS